MIFCSKCLKINNIINKLLLAGDKFIPDMYLRQPGFTYGTCGSFTKYQNSEKRDTLGISTGIN